MTGAMALTSSIEEPAMVTFGSYNSTGMDIAKIKWIKDIIIEHELTSLPFKNTSKILKLHKSILVTTLVTNVVL